MDALKKIDGICELHVHLDGSIRPETFLELYDNIFHGEFKNVEDVKSKLAFQVGWDLPQCLKSFATTLEILQTKESLERVAFELCEDLYINSNVTYAEIRYCPSLHREKGLTDEEIITAVASGLKRATKTYPTASFFQIITILRDLGPDEAMVMAKLACKFKMDKLIVGVDLAGNEYDHPPEKFADAFDLVFKNNLGITIHAGEGRTKQAEKNIITSINQLHATRIGHGVAARQSDKIRKILKDKNISVEICPTSNLHTGSITALEDHPAKQFFLDGIRVIPCCDNSLLSQTTTKNEYEILSQKCCFGDNEITKIATEAFDAAFFFRANKK